MTIGKTTHRTVQLPPKQVAEKKAATTQGESSTAPTRTGWTPKLRRGAPAVTATLAPANATEAQKFAHYAAIVRANGGEVNPGGLSTVLALRGVSPQGNHHELSSSTHYDDTFVVLRPDGRVKELAGATHPGRTDSLPAPDVNRDGVPDIGVIRPGSFMVVPNGKAFGGDSYRVLDLKGKGALPGWRDTNQDGQFSAEERATSQSRGDALTGVLFHPGMTDAPLSIGCQTMPPDTFKTFVEAVGGPKAKFAYTLVDAAK